MYCDDLTDASALPAKGDYSEDDAYRATRGFAKTMLLKHTCSKVILPLPKRYFMILLK